MIGFPHPPVGCSCSNPPIPEHLLWCYLHLWPHHPTCQCRHTDHTVGPLKVPHHTVIATLPGLGKKLPELFAFLLASLLTSTEQALFGNPNTLGWEAPPNNAPLIPLFHVNIILSLPPILQIQPTQQRAIRFPNIFQTFGRYREPDPFPV